ncbi:MULTISPECIES: LysR family transcriptional regulator [Proteus]|jgi:DNA-binding transcriptional LysR family regulator|uniref:Putative DNA-binding transcriptional regulator n=1 Tax=Proteus vulgaris TaxID=585 RepID=A0A379FBD4_PROVU|nr:MULTISPECIES: LysR family transcriptional regulator [Proteus]NBN58594.1 LysR family transcriptional regulator [Proteus sp. G2639]RNT31748.1 LysR family transcriptional regulator [Proteus mirabilis]AYY81781.1 LysR family transcriptional regulator [Proteus vulgaris]KGA55658.1 bacterial regulatory helix-turn-helix, lysR family protein [Proteus vulgaris]MBG5972452.1 LysR family transcriptional regulator [Proteus vulgaris]
MNLSQLDAFLLLADGFNVTETAERLFCTQPSVSIKIRKLEEELQTTLFERINNRLYLTPQGKVYQQYATQIINLVKSSAEHMRQFDDPSKGEIKFGASHFVGVYLLPQIMAQFRKQYPDVKLSMDISSSTQLIHKLDTQELEFLIMSDHIYLDPTEYHLDTFLIDPLVLICSPKHWLAQKKHCRFSDIASEVFLIKPEHSATRDFLLDRIKENNKEIKNVMEINSLEGIKQGVIHGLGISVLSRLSILQELESGLLCEIPFDDIQFSRGIRYFHHKEKYISPATKNFLSVLQSQAKILTKDINK